MVPKVAPMPECALLRACGGHDARLVGVVRARTRCSGVHSLLLPPLGHRPLQLRCPKSAHALRSPLQRARQAWPGRLHSTLHGFEDSAACVP